MKLNRKGVLVIEVLLSLSRIHRNDVFSFLTVLMGGTRGLRVIKNRDNFRDGI